MRRKLVCQVCKGTGREEHSFFRNDGELVRQSVTCESCKGSGVFRVKDEDILSARSELRISVDSYDKYFFNIEDDL